MKKRTTELKRRSFERIVVLVDITVVLLQRKPERYSNHICNSVERILQLCNAHSNFSTQWGYKFFDPSMSPMAFRKHIGEVLGAAPIFGEFDAFPGNLDKFKNVLKLMVNNHKQYNSKESRGKYIANAINDVFGLYTWDPLLLSESSSSDEGSVVHSKDRPVGNCPKRDSCAIILFSSVPATWSGANCFFDVPQLVGDNPPAPAAQVILDDSFRKLGTTLTSSNIQVCFVDVPMHQDLWSDERLETLLNPNPARKVILKSLSALVHTVIESELLALSPTLLPCDVIWNTMVDLGIDKSRKWSYARVLLNKDTPLCDVRWQPFKAHGASSCSVLAMDKLDIVLNSVLPKRSVNMKATCERFLLRQSSRPRDTFACEDRDAFGDKVLELLDQREFRRGQPGWQLLLLSLASQKAICEVSLYNKDDGHSSRAILEPFTSQRAILIVFEKGIVPANTHRVENLSSLNCVASEELGSGDGVKTVKRRRDAVPYHKHERLIGISSRKKRKSSSDVDTTNDSHEDSEGEGKISALTEFTSDCGNLLSRYIECGEASKLLQIMDNFLKESKQQPAFRNDDSVGALAVTVAGVEPLSVVALPDNSDTEGLPRRLSEDDSGALESGDAQLEERNEPLAEVHKQSNISVAVDEEVPPSECDPRPSLGNDMTLEGATEYISSVGKRIEDFLSSTDVDSLRFAGMLLEESQKSLRVIVRQGEDQKRRSVVGDHTGPDLNRRIATKLKKLLLKSPKQLVAKYKDCAGSTFGTTSTPSVDEKVKEHELQILLRLEMISVDEGRLLEQTAKDQFVNDICTLLDTIQFHLDGGIFGKKSLLKYCERILASRYKISISSTISKILSMMELDGYSEPVLSTCGSESLKEIAGNVQATGEWHDAIVDKSSSRACSDPPIGISDLDVLLRSQKVKKSYYFASHRFITTRKFKSGWRPPSDSKLSKRRGKQRIRIQDSPVKIVCQTPAPATAPSSRGADEVTQQMAVAPPMEFAAHSPTHERVGVEQTSLVVEETPFVRKRLNRVIKENLAGSDVTLSGKLTHIDMTSNTFCNTSADCPSKVSRRPSVSEARAKQGVGGDFSFSALLTSAVPQLPRMEGIRNLGSNLGNPPPIHSDVDEIEDDGDDGVVSTPFKCNAADDSRSSLESFLSDRPLSYKSLDLFAQERNSRDGFSGLSLHSSPTLKSTGPSRPACGAHVRAGELPSFALDTNMTRDWGASEGIPLPARHSGFKLNAKSNSVKEWSVHQQDFVEYSCPKDMPLGKVTNGVLDLSARIPRSPLGVISDNSAPLAPSKKCPSMELCSVSDTLAEQVPETNAGVQYPSATIHNKENHSTVNRKRSTNAIAGLMSVGGCERKTRSMTLLEQNMAPQQIFSTRRRKGRFR